MPTPITDLSLVQLRCFVAVVDAGSFAEAGRRIGLSVSAISKTIARFEAAYGLKLLHRSTHALSLTEDGEQVIDAARVAIRSITALAAGLEDAASSGRAGRVRISAPVAFLRRRLVPLLPAFAAALPDVQLDLRAENEIIDLAESGVDLTIRSGALTRIPGHIAQPWFRYPWVVCATPHYFARRGRPEFPEDLATHDLIGYRNKSSGVVRPWRLRGAATDEGGEGQTLAPFHPRIVIDDGEAAWGAACSGIGVTMAPLWLAVEALESGAMMEVLRDCRCDQTQVSIVRRDRRHAPSRVEAVIAFLKANTPSFPTDLA
jgi:DNA-binding transcriptional LysR family regulator